MRKYVIIPFLYLLLISCSPYKNISETTWLNNSSGYIVMKNYLAGYRVAVYDLSLHKIIGIEATRYDGELPYNNPVFHFHSLMEYFHNDKTIYSISKEYEYYNNFPSKLIDTKLYSSLLSCNPSLSESGFFGSVVVPPRSASLTNIENFD